jgi:hypothetical protein
MTKEIYGFDGILGVDFMERTGMIIDFKNFIIKYG